MKRSWTNARFAQSPLGRRRDLAALRRLGTDLSNRFEGMTLDLDAKQELVADWAIPVTFPATCRDPNRFLVALARRGVRLEAVLAPPYTGYRYVLRVPKTRPTRCSRYLLAIGCAVVALCLSASLVAESDASALLGSATSRAESWLGFN